MARSKELEKIKKIYGEKFMHLCRELFPTILEREGKLLQILESSFAGNSRTLYDDIIENDLEEEFKDYVYGKIDVEDHEMEIMEEKTPYELLDEAGYVLTECTTEEEIQSYRRYYATNEELCTFRGGRLDKCFVFWAVKKNAEEIERRDIPKREDEYGTSVMSIQFNKTGVCAVSIKNRYNHSVNNPDSTYGNNLDNIIPGLTKSFENLLEQRGMTLNGTNQEKFLIPGYVVANDGKYYKYNMEINGIYYCPGNIVIENGEIHRLEPEKQILLDYFVLDLEKKKISLYDNTVKDSFTEGLQDIKSIDVRRDKNKHRKIVTIQTKNGKNPIIVELNDDNEIIIYKNEDVTKVGNAFLCYNEGLRQLNLPNLQYAGDDFLYWNTALMELNLPNLKRVGNCFLYNNEGLAQIDFPDLEQVGDGFLYYNNKLEKLELPKLEQAGDGFLCCNEILTTLILPSLKKAGESFLYYNDCLEQVDLQSLEQVGEDFLQSNNRIDIEKVIEENKKKRKVEPEDIEEAVRKSNITMSEIQDEEEFISEEEKPEEGLFIQ